MNINTEKSILGQRPNAIPMDSVPATSAQALASGMLAAGVAALVVTADHLLDDWADTHTLAAWLALWAVAVMAIVVLRGVSRLWAQSVMRGLDRWSAGLARRRADERLWAMAQSDSRLMDELQTAMDRADDARGVDLTTEMTRRAARVANSRMYHI